MSGDILNYAIYGTLVGILGTALGGFAAFFTQKKGGRFLSSVLEYAAGLMLSVVLLDLLPEAFEYASLLTVIIFSLIGIAFMAGVEELVALSSRKKGIISSDKMQLRTVGIAMAIGIALHNLPEGLAIGCGFDAKFSLGLSLAITILIHNIPEGVAMAVPLRAGGVKAPVAVLVTALSGVPTGIGALMGAYLGTMSRAVIGIGLSLASGAMLYVVLCDLIPESKRIYKGRLACFCNILGIMTGIIISQLRKILI